MKIKFIQNYQGRETAMQEKFIGDELDCGTAFALALIGLGVAEEVVQVDELVNEEIPMPKKRYKKEVINDTDTS